MVRTGNYENTGTPSAYALDRDAHAIENGVSDEGCLKLMERFWEQVREDLKMGYRTRIDDKGRLVPVRGKNGKPDANGAVAVQTFAFLHSDDFAEWVSLMGSVDTEALRIDYLASYWKGPMPTRRVA